MKKLIKEFINQAVAESPKTTLFREPLLGFAAADDEIFVKLKEVAYPKHMLPQDLLPSAKTVFAFFLPFAEEVSFENRGGSDATRAWAETYVITNDLISQVCSGLKESLLAAGVNMAWLLPTHEFDKQELKAVWSHRHVAYACGLGTFGLNNLLITSKGCGGRFGTGVIDTYIEPSVRGSKIHHCFHHSTGCNYCLRKCPINALSADKGAKLQEVLPYRQKCFEHCKKADLKFKDLGSVEVCGKCATGPCGFIP